MRVPWSDISLNCKVRKHEVKKKKKRQEEEEVYSKKKRLKQVIRLLKKKKTENHAWIKEQQNDMHELDRQYNDNSEN
jgi:hypothetical protein